MAYIPGFEFDIFISYAHVDNLKTPEEESGWIDQFHQHLEVGLSKRVGRVGAVKIWRDPALDGSQLFDRTIEDKINAAALFLAMTSQGYRESDYCQQELKWFFKKAREESLGLEVGDRYRISNILLNNIPQKEWPAEYGRTSGFPFHDAANAEEFGEPSLPKNPAFSQQIRQLVGSIYKTLCASKEGAPSEEPISKEADSAPAEAGKFTVYFAETADSQRTTHKRTINELQQKGIQVVSGVPPPHEAAPHETRVIEEVTKADLTIHLLDQFPGREIDDDPGMAYTQKQVELSLGHAKTQFIWVPQKLDMNVVEDEAYKQFLSGLEHGARDEAKYEFVRGSADSLTQEILEKIEQVMAQSEQASTATAQSFLVDTHLKDQLHAMELSKYLLEKNIQPFLNPQEDDPWANLNILEERLKQVSTLIIVFGQVAKEWVLERLSAALQLIVAKNYAISTCGVYLAPPKKDTGEVQINQRFLKVHLLDNSASTDFNPKTLAPLLENMRAGGGP